MKLRYVLVSIGTVLLAGACGGGASNAAVGNGLAGTSNTFERDDKLRVATTVAPLTSIVLEVAGKCAYVHGLIAPGIDSHTYEPKPFDAVVLSRADVFIMNGASLESTMEDLAKANLPDPDKIYKLADNTLQGDDERSGFLFDFSFPRANGKPNPHLWMDPLYARKYAELVRDWLSANDPDESRCYAANYDRFADALQQLDQAIRADAMTVPERSRRLLTYHDSWAYWAREYGWTVIGAIQPSDFSEPSAREVADIILQVKSEGVPVVFGSEVFPSAVMETIAAESGARFEDRLRDDEPPGPVDDPGHTYIGMMVANMQILITALGGRADRVVSVPVENSFGR